MAAPPRVQSEPSPSFMTQGWWELCNRHSVNVFSSCFFQGSNCLIISLLAGQKPKRNDLTGQLGKWFVEILGPRKSLGPLPGWHPLEGSLTKKRGAGSKRKAGSRSWALEEKAPAARLQVKKWYCQRAVWAARLPGPNVNNGGREGEKRKEWLGTHSIEKLGNERALWRSLSASKAESQFLPEVRPAQDNEISVSPWCGHRVDTSASTCS